MKYKRLIKIESAYSVVPGFLPLKFAEMIFVPPFWIYNSSAILISFDLARRCRFRSSGWVVVRKKPVATFSAIYSKHRLYSPADKFNIQLNYICYIKELPVIVHETVKLHHKWIMRTDPFEILFGISHEELIKQAVILVSVVIIVQRSLVNQF